MTVISIQDKMPEGRDIYSNGISDAILPKRTSGSSVVELEGPPGPDRRLSQRRPWGWRRRRRSHAFLVNLCSISTPCTKQPTNKWTC